jgi:two-component system, NtrC family, sensor kinase
MPPGSATWRSAWRRLKDKADAWEQLQTHARELAEAQEQQRAVSEILRVISSSPTDTQPVFDAITQSAKRLCDGDLVAVFRFDGTMVHPVTVTDLSPEAAEEFARAFPQRPDPHSLVGRAILDRTVVHTADVEHDHRLSAEARSRARLRGRRSAIQVPMLRGDGRAHDHSIT